MMALRTLVDKFHWFTAMANFKAIRKAPLDLKSYERKNFFQEANRYVWDDLHIFKIGVDNLLRRCVTKNEVASLLWQCHNSPYEAHFNGERTIVKVL